MHAETLAIILRKAEGSSGRIDMLLGVPPPTLRRRGKAYEYGRVDRSATELCLSSSHPKEEGGAKPDGRANTGTIGSPQSQRHSCSPKDLNRSTSTVLRMATPRPPIDHRHAKMLLGYIAEMEAKGFVLHGTEVPYRKTNGHGFIDVMMYRQHPTTGTTNWLVTEVKTDLVDIGRTTRQVLAAREFVPTHHRQLFKSHRAQTIRYPLVVWASDANLIQCLNYSRLFEGIDVEFHHPNPDAASAAANKFQIHSAIAHAAATPPSTRNRDP